MTGGGERVRSIGLWSSSDLARWRAALDRYPDVIEAQRVKRLRGLDDWYRAAFPGLLAERHPPFVTAEELVRTTEWKMARGIWRQRNLLLVRSNEPGAVEETSREAFAKVPDPGAPIAWLSRLSGVGPATASAILAAYRPDVYPFFDDLVADQIPNLGPVDYSLKDYRAYANALRERANALGHGWTPVLVERALWANAGGKAAFAQSGPS